jgi:hypothetical protein
MIDNIAIVGDHLETQTNGRYNEDDDLGNNKVFYLHIQKLEKYETEVYRADTQIKASEKQIQLSH